MQLLPAESETLVLPYSGKEVFERIRQVTRPLEPYLPLSVQEEDFRFNGVVETDEFRLSRKITRPNSFLPIIIGKVAPTSKGCLVFLSYKLFSSTLLFIGFWSVLTLLISLYFFFYEKLYGYGSIAIVIGIFNYVIALLNFQKQVKISRQLIKHTLQVGT
ncbi:hypothetical protein [Tunicatimonas pelagia]|uniref:hypothetical protein n=1 Tax=Tunicatimonas pelagia TaxID=931531 RepID=UPI00266619C2|nr:hypothetical protein [Tunicatimonas pelagia]WKN45942.1 hypothetical protein P0M28_13340 [Tunicatimonas pelagia]